MESDNIICPTCGATNTNTSHFCVDCGANLQDQNSAGNQSYYQKSSNEGFNQDTKTKFFSIERDSEYYANTRIMTDKNEEVFSTTDAGNSNAIVYGVGGGMVWFVAVILSLIIGSGILAILTMIGGFALLVFFIVFELNKSIKIDIFSKYEGNAIIRENFKGWDELSDFLSGRNWICQGSENNTYFSSKIHNYGTGNIQTNSGDYLINTIRDTSGLYYRANKEMDIIDKNTNQPVVRLLCPENRRDHFYSTNIPMSFQLYVNQNMDDFVAIGFAVIMLKKFLTKSGNNNRNRISIS